MSPPAVVGASPRRLGRTSCNMACASWSIGAPGCGRVGLVYVDAQGVIGASLGSGFGRWKRPDGRGVDSVDGRSCLLDQRLHRRHGLDQRRYWSAPWIAVVPDILVALAIVGGGYRARCPHVTASWVVPRAHNASALPAAGCGTGRLVPSTGMASARACMSRARKRRLHTGRRPAASRLEVHVPVGEAAPRRSATSVAHVTSLCLHVGNRFRPCIRRSGSEASRDSAVASAVLAAQHRRGRAATTSLRHV